MHAATALGAWPVSQPGSWIYTLSVFLRQAQQDGAITADAQVNSLGSKLGQQLESAGFLQQLPAVISEAAQQLADLQGKPEAVLAGLAESASGAKASQMSQAAWQYFVMFDNLQYLLALLGFVRALWLKDQLTARVYQPSVLPLMQLFVRLMQHASFCLSQLSDSPQTSTMIYHKVLMHAHTVVTQMVVPVAHRIMDPDAPKPQQQGQQQPAERPEQKEALEAMQQELAQSPYACQATGLLLVISSYAGILQRQYAAGTLPLAGSGSSSSSVASRAATSSSSGSARSSSSSSISSWSSRSDASIRSGAAARHPAAAMSRAEQLLMLQGSFGNSWGLACSRHHLVPAAHDELLEALGCSSKAVLLVAAVAAWPSHVDPHSYAIPAATSGVVESVIYCRLVSKRQSLINAKVDVFSSGQFKQSGLQWTAADEQKLHLLLPSVLLLNAAEAPSSGAEAADYLTRCYIAGQCGSAALSLWVTLCGFQTGTNELLQMVQQFMQSPGGNTSTVQPAQSDLELAAAVTKLQLVAAQVEEAMYICARYMLPTLLGLCQADMGTSSGSCQTRRASGSSSSSSSSSSSGGGGPAAGSSSSARRGTAADRSSTQKAQHKQLQQDSVAAAAATAFQAVLNYICLLNQMPFGSTKQDLATAIDVRKLVGRTTRGSLRDAVLADAVEAKAAAADDDDGAWSQDATQLGGTVECYVRLQAATPSHMAQNDAGLAVLCGRVLLVRQWHDGGLLLAALAAGPGSPQQTQLFGLLCSLLKFTSQLPPQYEARLTDAVLAAALASASILRGTAAADFRSGKQQLPQVQQLSQLLRPHLSSAPAGFQHDTTAEAVSGVQAAGDCSNQPSATTAVCLPWLVLCGRCCCIWAERLLQGAAGQHQKGPTSEYMRFMEFVSTLDIFTKRLPMSGMLTVLLQVLAHNDLTTGADTSGSTVPVSCLEACRAWLSVPSTSAQLTAIGYDMGLLNSKLDAALQAASAVQQPEAGAGSLLKLPAKVTAALAQPAQTPAAGSHSVSAAAVMQLVQQLRALGEALSTLAISSACNNPACNNISGPSEAELVKGSSSTCGGCRAARYCCKACQSQHWKLHKQVCKALAAARSEGLCPGLGTQGAPSVAVSSGTCAASTAGVIQRPAQQQQQQQEQQQEAGPEEESEVLSSLSRRISTVSAQPQAYVIRATAVWIMVILAFAYDLCRALQ
jgi:hypothetical protein